MKFASLRAQFAFKGGDVNGAINLFFDNLATLLAIIFNLNLILRNFYDEDLMDKVNSPDPDLAKEMELVTETIDDIIFRKSIPGLAMTMVFGNIYYSVMGARLGAKLGREAGQTTALPYGVNTPGAFAFLFGVIAPAVGVALGNLGCEDLPFTTPEEAQVVAQCWSDVATAGWSAGVVANFVVGLISFGLGFLGPLILKVTPVPALLTSLAGIGFAFLGINQLSATFQDPLSGLLPLFLTMVLYYGEVSVGRVPKSLLIVAVGTILAWADGVTNTETLKQASELVAPYGVSTGLSAFDAFSTIVDNIGTIIPVAFAAASNTLMNVLSAKKAGDDYGAVETMLSDAFGTIVGAFFGTPFGTSVYIGHPAYKKMGAGVAYSFLNCIVFFFFAIFGIFSVVSAVIPTLAVAPLLLFVGLMIVQEAFDSGPTRHYPGIIVGMIPSVVDLMLNSGASSDRATNFVGLQAIQPSAILLSMFLAAISIYSIDRKFLNAFGWSLAAAFAAAIGLLHQPAVSFEDWTTPKFGTDANLPWRYMVGWLLVAVLMLSLHFLQKKDLVDPIIEGENIFEEEEEEVKEKPQIGVEEENETPPLAV